MQKKIKRLLRKLPLFPLLRDWYRSFVPAPKSRIDMVQERILQALENKSEVFFIQVGANDGVRGDPLRRLIIENPHWHGIFVEPLTLYFRRLKANYEEAARFIFENVAIAEQKGSHKIYYVAEEAKKALGNALPDWFYGLGSFDRDHILNHFPALGERILPYIVEEQIEAVPLQQLLERNGVKGIDVLTIDTEGYDYKILSQVDFELYRPAVIFYEHKHLCAEEKLRAVALLDRYGYSCAEYGGDTLALRSAG